MRQLPLLTPRQALSLSAGTAALLLTGVAPAAAQTTEFLYGITNGGQIYEIDVQNKTTTLAFTTGLNYMNGLAFNESGDNGNGQLFYRAGTSSLNGSTGLYMWNRRTNQQVQVAVPTSVIASGVLNGQSSNASWYNGAYWYVQQGTDTLRKVNIDLTNFNAPFVSSIESFTNFDGTAMSNYAFGDISISSSGVLYGSASSIFFSVNISSGSPNASTYTQASSSTQLQLGFGADGSTLYGEVAGTGQWYTVNKATGVATDLGFTSAAAFNDISEGSVRSITAVASPEPSSLALVLLVPAAGIGYARRRRTVTSR